MLVCKTRITVPSSEQIDACVRYRLSRRKQILAEHFDVTPFDDDWESATTSPHTVSPRHPPASERTRPTAFADDVGKP